MAKIEVHICDRCGARIKESFFSRMTGKIHLHNRFGFGAFSYSDCDVELCRECADKLSDWLHPKEADHE